MKRKVHENQCGLFVDPTSKKMLKDTQVNIPAIQKMKQKEKKQVSGKTEGQAPVTTIIRGNNESPELESTVASCTERRKNPGRETVMTAVS